MNKYIIIFFLMIQELFSLGVRAGTSIKNSASLSYRLGNTAYNSVSNEVVDVVDQKLDMKMVCSESKTVVVGVGEKKRAMSFILSNGGNAEDTYSFSHVEGSTLDFNVKNTEIYLDNGNGLFSMTEDSLTTEVMLNADENVSLFLVADIPDDASDYSSNGIKANSITQGALVYGESKKLNHFYVLVATQEDAKSDFCTYEVSPLSLKLEKTATLSSDKTYHGSTITYKIAVKVIGTGNIDNAVVRDDIPIGTTYVADSLRLDGISAGDFNGSTISMALNPIFQNEPTLDAIHEITFNVKVK